MRQESGKPIILLVDDTPSEIDMIRSALEGKGYDVFIATSGEKAVKRAGLTSPDLILLDIMVPGKTTPLFFCQAIKFYCSIKKCIETANHTSWTEPLATHLTACLNSINYLFQDCGILFVYNRLIEEVYE